MGELPPKLTPEQKAKAKARAREIREQLDAEASKAGGQAVNNEVPPHLAKSAAEYRDSSKAKEELKAGEEALARIRAAEQAQADFEKNLPPPHQYVNGRDQAPDTPRGKPFTGFITLAEFLDQMKPPDYLTDGLLLRGSTYTITGNTGHCKTLLTILLAIRVAGGDWFCGRKCRQGTVVYFAGENPDNVRIQFYAMCDAMEMDFRKLPIVIHPGVFDTKAMRERVRADVALYPDLGLTIFDSLQAFFMGEEDNKNVAMLNLASDFRSLTEHHPNRPTGLITAHPVKNASRDQLLPRGGSSLTNELDGNLTAWLDGDAVTLHWLGKYRGIPFDPIQLEQVVVKPAGLLDAEGNQMPATIVRPVGEIRAAEIAREENRVRTIILIAISENASVTQHDLALRANVKRWTVRRIISEFTKDKWLRNYSGKLKLTREGEKALELAKS